MKNKWSCTKLIGGVPKIVLYDGLNILAAMTSYRAERQREFQQTLSRK